MMKKRWWRIYQPMRYRSGSEALDGKSPRENEKPAAGKSVEIMRSESGFEHTVVSHFLGEDTKIKKISRDSLTQKP